LFGAPQAVEDFIARNHLTFFFDKKLEQLHLSFGKSMQQHAGCVAEFEGIEIDLFVSDEVLR
jgi:hypothetical protein